MTWDFAESRAKLVKMIEAHTKAKGVTDLHGKITFDPVVPGSYYIAGWSTTRKKNQMIIWNYHVTVKPGPQEACLSSEDAAMDTFHLDSPLRR